jgi:hypothetical protein
MGDRRRASSVRDRPGIACKSALTRAATARRS